MTRSALLALAGCLGCSGAGAAGAGAGVGVGAGVGAGAGAGAGVSACGAGDGSVGSGVLATGLGMPGPIVVDDCNVYWANLSPPAILKCAKTGCGGAPTVLARGEWPNVTRLVLHDKDLYWGGGSVIFACATGGCDGKPAMFPVQAVVSDLAVSAEGEIFFVVTSQFFSPKIDECSAVDCDGGTSLSSGLAPQTVRLNPPPLPDEIAVDAQDLFFVLDSSANLMACTIGSCPATAHSIFPLNGPVNPPPVLTLDSQNVYLAGASSLSGGASIAVVPKDGFFPPDASTGGAPGMLLDALSPIAGLAVDDGAVYFAELGAMDATGGVPAGAGRIGKCAIGGCNGTPEIVQDYVSAPGGLAVDDTRVYWTEQGVPPGPAAGRVVSHAK